MIQNNLVMKTLNLLSNQSSTTLAEKPDALRTMAI